MSDYIIIIAIMREFCSQFETNFHNVKKMNAPSLMCNHQYPIPFTSSKKHDGIAKGVPGMFAFLVSVLVQPQLC